MKISKEITKPSKRPTDRAPHMGKYARVGKRWGKPGVDLIVGNQRFFLPVSVDSTLTKGQIAAHVTWTRDMLCIALDELVKLETQGESDEQ